MTLTASNRLAVLEWLLSFAVSLEYADNGEPQIARCHLECALAFPVRLHTALISFNDGYPVLAVCARRLHVHCRCNNVHSVHHVMHGMCCLCHLVQQYMQYCFYS